MEHMRMKAHQSSAGLVLNHNKQPMTKDLPSHDWSKTHRDLWQRLANFNVDDTSACFPLSARLAREQGWSRAFAQRVVEEYKKFLFLGCISSHQISPSKAVDAAWHLHMIYTRSYWDELCATVLQRPFHHGPTKGGIHESAKFHDWYASTLSMYERVFGVAAPADIWPAPGQQFESRARWVDANTHWIVPKHSSMKAGGLVGVGLVSLAMAGCGITMAQQQSSKSVVLVVAVVVIVMITIFLAARAIVSLNGSKKVRLTRTRRRNNSGDGSTSIFFFGGSDTMPHHGHDQQFNHEPGPVAGTGAYGGIKGTEAHDHQSGLGGHHSNDATGGNSGGDAAGGDGGGSGCGGGGD